MRMLRNGRVLTLCAVVALVACQHPGPQPPRAAVDAIGRLRVELGGALRAALAKGPEHAIEVCRLDAPRLTALQQRDGIRVGRTSDRLRNPANAPEPWMQPLLAEFRERAPEPGAHRSVDLGARGTGYVEPIYLKPLCATCHGENVAPPLLDAIRARYPEDRATGFRVGELRGLFWAVVEGD